MKSLTLTRGASVLLCIVALTTAASCDRPDQQSAAPPPEPQLTPGGERSIPPRESRHFDAATLRVGDRFNDLSVASIDVRRVFDDSVWVGRVAFSGEITLRGVYQRHFDWPEPDALCFHVTDAASVQRVPGFAPDTWTAGNEKVWFCFENPGLAQELIGPGDVPLEATIVVDDYVVWREFTDIFDVARLVAVHGTPAPGRQSLRDP